jgi:hypothetical protein
VTLQDQLRSLADDVDRAPHVDTAAHARQRAESYRRRGRVVTAVTAVAVLTLKAPEPPRTLYPRLVTGLSIVILLSGAASLLLWRRRARI